MQIILLPLGISRINLQDAEKVLINMKYQVTSLDPTVDQDVSFKGIESKEIMVLVLNETGVSMSLEVSKIVARAISSKVVTYFLRKCHDASIIGARDLDGNLCKIDQVFAPHE